MLHFYNIVTTDLIGQTYVTWLAHPTKHHPEEFRKLIFNVSPEAAYRRRASGQPVKGFTDIAWDVIELLVERYGFIPMEPDAVFNIDESKGGLLCPVRNPQALPPQALYEELSDWLRAHDLRELDPAEYPSQYAMMLNEVTPREQEMRDYLASGGEVTLNPVDVHRLPTLRVQVEAWQPFWKAKS